MTMRDTINAVFERAREPAGKAFENSAATPSDATSAARERRVQHRELNIASAASHGADMAAARAEAAREHPAATHAPRGAVQPKSRGAIERDAKRIYAGQQQARHNAIDRKPHRQLIQDAAQRAAAGDKQDSVGPAGVIGRMIAGAAGLYHDRLRAWIVRDRPRTPLNEAEKAKLIAAASRGDLIETADTILATGRAAALTHEDRTARVDESAAIVEAAHGAVLSGDSQTSDQTGDRSPDRSALIAASHAADRAASDHALDLDTGRTL